MEHTEQGKTFAKDGIRAVMKQLVAHGAEHGLGAEQIRTILDEVLIDFVDYGKGTDDRRRLTTVPQMGRESFN